MRAALLDTNPATAFNPFGLNQNTKAALDRVFTTTKRLGATRLTLEDLKLYGDLFSLPAGPVSFAVGGEYRTEESRRRAGLAHGFWPNPWRDQFGPTNGSRDSRLSIGKFVYLLPVLPGRSWPLQPGIRLSGTI